MNGTGWWREKNEGGGLAAERVTLIGGETVGGGKVMGREIVMRGDVAMWSAGQW